MAISGVIAVVERGFWKGIFGAESYRLFSMWVTKCHVTCVFVFIMLARYVCACSLCLYFAHYANSLLTMPVFFSICLKLAHYVCGLLTLSIVCSLCLFSLTMFMLAHYVYSLFTMSMLTMSVACSLWP